MTSRRRDNPTPEQTENLLVMARELAEFEAELGLAPEGAARSVRGEERNETGRSLRWKLGVAGAALAAAAAVAVTVGVFMVLGPGGKPALPGAGSGSGRTALLPVPPVRPPEIEPGLLGPADGGDAIEVAEQNVHMVVALYRQGDEPRGPGAGSGDDCTSCWCVTQWTPDWSQGRGLCEVPDAELLTGSMDRRCVTSPKRVIVVGLSGPASAMPSSDEHARELALCLAQQKGKLSSGSVVTMPGQMAQMASSQVTCVPVGVDYRIASWTR
jgi:hypothetical protein